jgi:hypothetical protein
MRKQANLEIQFRESERGWKGEGGEEASNPESEHLPAKAHRTSFSRKRSTLIAKMKGESPDARIPCGPVWLSPETDSYENRKLGYVRSGKVPAPVCFNLPSASAAHPGG